MLRNFIDQGWEFGGRANLSAMVGGQGGQFSGAAAVSPGVYLYQLTNTGLSATITVSGTKSLQGRGPELRPATVGLTSRHPTYAGVGCVK